MVHKVIFFAKTIQDHTESRWTTEEKLHAPSSVFVNICKNLKSKNRKGMRRSGTRQHITFYLHAICGVLLKCMWYHIKYTCVNILCMYMRKSHV